jgi:hypothetical protein
VRGIFRTEPNGAAQRRAAPSVDWCLSELLDWVLVWRMLGHSLNG